MFRAIIWATAANLSELYVPISIPYYLIDLISHLFPLYLYFPQPLTSSLLPLPSSSLLPLPSFPEQTPLFLR